LALLAILVLVATVVVRDLSEDLINIEPISVPKVVADNGFTAEIGSRRLRDALTSYAKKAGTSMKGPSVSPRSELPDFVVPGVGLSMDTIVSGVRSILHYGSRQTISGELITRSNQAWLRLRVDGEEVYSSPGGSDIEQLDEMFADAAPAVLEEIRPYLIASTIYDKNEEEGLRKAQEIIDRLPESDPNVQWAYLLIAGHYFNHNDHSLAKRASTKALSLNGANEIAHVNYGLELEEDGELGIAHAEAKRALRLNPQSAAAHLFLGRILAHELKFEQAFAELQRAVAIAPKSAFAHVAYGVILGAAGLTDDAMEEIRQSAQLDPTSAQPHIVLGKIFLDQEQFDHAAAEYRRAIALKPNRANAHAFLGDVLAKQGDLAAAATEYKRAIELDPRHIEAHDSLGYVRQQQNRWKEADHVFCRAMELEQEDRDRRSEARAEDLMEQAAMQYGSVLP
jgi:Tfp pilus assembly protein PilF